MRAPSTDKADNGDKADKAGMLAWLATQGLPVLPLRVIGAHETAADVARDVATWLPLLVRSSMAGEDRPGATAAGIFVSRKAQDVAQLTTAIDAVRASAHEAPARAYGAAAVQPGLFAQPWIDGDAIVVATRAPSQGATADACWLSINGGPRVIESRTAPSAAHGSIVQLALAVEAAAGLALTGADVELMRAHAPSPHVATPYATDPTLIVVQARALASAVQAPRRPPMPEPLWAPLAASGRRWLLDLAHNPEPLSVAQQELVRAVQEAGASPVDLCTVAGYLYFVDAPEADAPEADAPEAEAPVAEAPTLRAAFDHAWAAIDALTATPTTDLADAVTRYVEGVRIWHHDLSPLARRAKAPLLTWLRAHNVPSPSRTAAHLIGANPHALAARASVATTVDDRRALLSEFAALATAWDVCAPTLAERPDAAAQLDQLATMRALRLSSNEIAAALDREARAGVDERVPATLVALAQLGAEFGERDDLAFARLQAMVRTALLQRGHALDLPSDDIFWIPWAELHAGRDRLHALATANRRAHARAAAWMPPVAVPRPSAAATWHGEGFGASVTGPVVRLDPLAASRAIPAGAVVVTAALTPAMALSLGGARAVVAATGSCLDHGATIARELGLTYLARCPSPWTDLDDGDLLEVDGDAGTARAVGPSSR